MTTASQEKNSQAASAVATRRPAHPTRNETDNAMLHNAAGRRGNNEQQPAATQQHRPATGGSRRDGNEAVQRVPSTQSTSSQVPPRRYPDPSRQITHHRAVTVSPPPLLKPFNSPSLYPVIRDRDGHTWYHNNPYGGAATALLHIDNNTAAADSARKPRHDTSPPAAPATSRINYCRHYLLGKCNRGALCRFTHIEQHNVTLRFSHHAPGLANSTSDSPGPQDNCTGDSCPPSVSSVPDVTLFPLCDAFVLPPAAVICDGYTGYPASQRSRSHSSQAASDRRATAVFSVVEQGRGPVRGDDALSTLNELYSTGVSPSTKLSPSLGPLHGSSGSTPRHACPDTSRGSSQRATHQPYGPAPPPEPSPQRWINQPYVSCSGNPSFCDASAAVDDFIHSFAADAESSDGHSVASDDGEHRHAEHQTEEDAQQPTGDVFKMCRSETLEFDDRGAQQRVDGAPCGMHNDTYATASAQSCPQTYQQALSHAFSSSSMVLPTNLVSYRSAPVSLQTSPALGPCAAPLMTGGVADTVMMAPFHLYPQPSHTSRQLSAVSPVPRPQSHPSFASFPFSVPPAHYVQQQHISNRGRVCSDSNSLSNEYASACELGSVAGLPAFSSSYGTVEVASPPLSAEEEAVLKSLW